jgi:glycosyltransferase involved in cell wall biosynthesis
MSSKMPLLTDSLPLVSVVIPTHNRSLLLRRALESVLGQRYDELEVIVVDDKSDDSTTEVTGDYQKKFKRFKYLRNIEKRGGAESRNIGISHSTGKYIAFLDDDDEWLPDKTIRQVKILEGDPYLGAVSCWFNRIDHKGNLKKTRLVPDVDFKCMLWENFMGSFSFCMVRNELARKIMLDPGLRSSQDWQFWIELSRTTKLRILDDYMVNYYDHAGERISRSDSSKLSGIRRVFLRYRKDMTRDCREYWITYLMLYKAVNFGITLNRKFIVKYFKLLMNPTARFVIKKILLLRITMILHLDVYDPTAVTYKFIKSSYCIK